MSYWIHQVTLLLWMLQFFKIKKTKCAIKKILIKMKLTLPFIAVCCFFSGLKLPRSLISLQPVCWRLDRPLSCPFRCRRSGRAVRI